MRSIVDAYLRMGLVPMIVVALVIGTLIGVFAPSVGLSFGILGSIFVGALKAVALCWCLCLFWRRYLVIRSVVMCALSRF